MCGGSSTPLQKIFFLKSIAELEGLPHQETAVVLELTVATVETRLHRARLFLRGDLADYFAKRRHTSA
jgi:DNA-directed RNA polymerase specialized sigma24 family protein